MMELSPLFRALLLIIGFGFAYMAGKDLGRRDWVGLAIDLALAATFLTLSMPGVLSYIRLLAIN